jgi:hypothetical protein
MRWSCSLVLWFIAGHVSAAELHASASQTGAREPSAPATAEGWVVPPGREQRAIDLLGDVGFERPLPSGRVWDSIGLARDHVDFSLHAAGQPPDAPPLARVRLVPADHARPEDRRAVDIAAHIDQTGPAVQQEVDAAVASILRRSQPGFFQRHTAPPGENRFAIGLGRVLVVAFGLLALWAALLVARIAWRREWQAIQFRFKPTHLLPALVQSTIYLWWAANHPAVRAQLPRMGAELVFAVLLDFLLGMTLRRRWDLTFGPLPIVLSANLFVWFPEQMPHLAFLVIALAIGSKWLLQRNGQHVVNPSAFGVAVVGVLCLAAPAWARFDDISHTLDVPGMMTLLLVAALLPQLRVPIVLVSIPAAVVLLALKHGGAYHVVYPFWPALYIAIALLATDPATSPRTGPGRLLYGLALGLGIWAVSAGLTAMGQHDVYGKVIPVPLLNWAVPWFDRWGARLGAVQAWLAPRWNLAHVAVWVVFAAGFIYF